VKKSQSSKQWLRRHVNDPYVQRSKKEGYRSRSAYKLTEIDERDKVLRPGMLVVDLGAAPGGWSQVAAKRIGEKGQVVAIDLLPMEPISNVTLLQADFASEEGLRAVEQKHPRTQGGHSPFGHGAEHERHRGERPGALHGARRNSP
jgi:23S rRNA (uridine2552-2'-O)-methyltransferase